MLNVKENLISILETFCPNNVFLQGTINPNVKYPDTFCTFFIQDSDCDAFYDDNPHCVNWSGAVMIYSTNPETIVSILSNVITSMRKNGFIPQGCGNDIPTYVETHTGWAIDFIYKENIY
jgi:hypothetical protein